MKVVIMAGGKGTRIASVNADVPKPMIEILGKPILQYQIENLKKQGCTDFILIIGHLGQTIVNYFQDGQKFGVNISYINEETPLGTAGALYYLKDKIFDDFLLVNGDIIFDINVKRFLQYHREKQGMATIFTHPNSHPYDSGLILSQDDGLVTKWLHKEDERLWYKNRVNAGLHFLSPCIFTYFNECKKMDLDRDILKKLIEINKLYAYDSPEYVKDMGTPDRYFSATSDIENGLVNKKNLQKKQKAIFLDRDGTINQYVGFLTNIDDFKLLDSVAESIKKINSSEYLAIVVTNQPVIARGEVSLDELNEIHNKMETLLGKEGAFIDDIYYCPHHPDKGFYGERKDYKIECNCRKPKPGMLIDAARKYNIDLSKSWMIGDDINDVKAGRAAGCKSIYLGTDDEIVCDHKSYSLKEAVEYILELGVE